MLRKLTNSEPVVVIANGRIIEQNMRKIRCQTTQLMMLLREKNAFNIGDVEFAVFETDGKLSVLKKSQQQPLTPADMKIPTPYKGLNKDLIIDGNVMRENLASANINEEGLRDMLAAQGIRDVREVFYGGVDTSGNLYVSKKVKRKEKEGQYGIE
jgi:uncharacterized membrane protein YcaP (DUF421 family)